MGVIYLDHLAATPLHPLVQEAMIHYIETVYGNPATDNQIGQPAAEALEQARGRVASLINAQPNEVVFNSGGTESVNHAIKGIAIGLREKGRHIITLRWLAILAMSAMGSMVPISLLASMTLMRMVSGVMAFSTSAGSTRPYLSTSREVTR